MATAESVKSTLQGIIDKSNRVTGNSDSNVSDAVDSLIAGFGNDGVIRTYEGEYEVTPKVTDQTLLTAGKRMADDLIVKKITYSSVGNDSGGYTITFGG